MEYFRQQLAEGTLLWPTEQARSSIRPARAKKSDELRFYRSKEQDRR
jgi:hypothetical protein